MSIEEILEMMDETLDKAVAVPFSGKKSLIDVEKMHELVYEIRSNMPKEIEQARNLVGERKIIMNEARSEADAIIKKAEERAKSLVSHQEITRLAQSRAEEIMINAQQKSKELRHTTNDYVDNMLGKAEELLSRNLADIKKARMALKSTGK
ncbi:MAG: ATPase [Oscillospiraceae bacterium]|jgi:vacuolar-type H+-ATPase subunit H|nr:ATPase [Oscillospiraceae bacterium]